MVGVENEQQVKRLGLDRIDLVGLGRHGKHHLQKILRVVEAVFRIHERLADTQLVRCRGNGRQFRNNPVRENIAMFRVMYVRSVVVVSGHGADNC